MRLLYVAKTKIDKWKVKDDNRDDGDSKLSPFRRACRDGDEAAVIAFLHNDLFKPRRVFTNFLEEEDSSAEYPDGVKGFLDASERGHTGVVKILLDNGRRNSSIPHANMRAPLLCLHREGAMKTL